MSKKLVESCIVILLVIVIVLQIYAFTKKSEEKYAASENYLDRYVGVDMKNGVPEKLILVDFFTDNKKGNISVVQLQRETKYPGMKGYICDWQYPGNISKPFTFDDKTMSFGNSVFNYQVTNTGALGMSGLPIPNVFQSSTLVVPGRVRIDMNGLLGSGIEVLQLGDTNNYMFNVLGIYSDRLVIESIPFELRKSTDTVLTKIDSNMSQTINVSLQSDVQFNNVGNFTIFIDPNTRTLDILENSWPIHSFPVN